MLSWLISAGFALFDALVRMASGGRPSHVAVLRLKSEAKERSVEKLFLSDMAAGAGGGSGPTSAAAQDRVGDTMVYTEGLV